MNQQNDRESHQEKRPRKEVFFLRFISPHQRGTDLYASLEAAKTAAWDMARSGSRKPREILDWRMQPVLGAKELREYLALQDQDWTEIEDWGDDIDFD